MEVDSARISLLLRGLNRKYPLDSGKWQYGFRDDGDLRLYYGEKVIIVPQAVLASPNTLDVFVWIEDNANL